MCPSILLKRLWGTLCVSRPQVDTSKEPFAYGAVLSASTARVSWHFQSTSGKVRLRSSLLGLLNFCLQVKDRILMFIHFHFTGPMLLFVDYPELADHGAPPADRCFGLPLPPVLR